MTEAAVTAEQPTEAKKGFAESPAREEKIRLRAYEFYLERKGELGDPDDDWFRAESEIADSPAVTKKT